MDGQTRLKIKVGDHTFEAEGSPEDVKEQYRLFVELVGSMPTVQPTIPQVPPPQEPFSLETPATAQTATFNDNSLGKIMKLEGRIVSLTVRPKLIGEAVLLLLLGQKMIRQSEYTTGAELIDGLRTTGGYTFNRIDKLMEKIAGEGDVLVTGEHRGKRYRMTNAGMAKARQIAQDLAALVP